MDFEQWWKTQGQFLPPLDLLTNGQVLNSYKELAKTVWEVRDAEVDFAYNKGRDEGNFTSSS